MCRLSYCITNQLTTRLEETRGITRRGASFANKISSSSFNGFFTSFFLGLLLSVAPYSRSLCAIDNITFMIIIVAYYCYCLRCAQLAHSGHHEWWYCWLSALCFVLSAILLDDGAHLLLLLLLLFVIHGCRSVCLLDTQWAHLFLFLLTLLIDSTSNWKVVEREMLSPLSN